MAERGSKKELSVRHEEFIARIYQGRRSRSSGAHVTDEGDVYVAQENSLVECKGKFGELAGSSPVRSTLLKQMEKVAIEAFDKGAEPMLALRFYAPDHVLAIDGWVDLTVRLSRDDARRSSLIRRYFGLLDAMP